MSKKLLLILAMALSAALIAAGCGDDDSTTSTSDSTEATTTASDDTGDVTTPVGTDSASIEAACKQAIEGQGVPISDEAKTEIENLCEEAASGSADPEQLQAVSQEVCEIVVRDNVPEGPTLDQALKTCATVGQ